MLEYGKAIFDLIKFGLEVKSSTKSQRTLDEIAETSRVINENISKVLDAAYETKPSQTKVNPQRRTIDLENKAICAAERAEHFAALGRDTKNILENASQRYEFLIRKARREIEVIPDSFLKDTTFDANKFNLGCEFSVRSQRAHENFSKLEILANDTLTVVSTLDIAGSLVIFQENDKGFEKIVIWSKDINDWIYERYIGLHPNDVKFETQKFRDSEGRTANFSTGTKNSYGPIPETKTKAYYIAEDLRYSKGRIVGSTYSENVQSDFLDVYEGEFMAFFRYIVHPL